MKTVSVVLAGGSGTRFWPLSRAESPKQVLNISGNDVMINETIRRTEGLIAPDDSFIVTAKSQLPTLDDVLLPELPRGNILPEPVQRNTAPCILYAALKLKKQYGDAVMCVFSADHYITNDDEFRRIIGEAARIAEAEDKLLTLGTKPAFPATGYGYIRFEREPASGEAHGVLEFVEKPNYERAQAYVKSGDYLWNSGIFVWKVSTILAAFERYLPRIYSKLLPWEEAIGTAREEDLLAEIYPELQKISIDFGILERSNDVLVIPSDFGWSDVGSWDALGTIFPPDEDGNIVRADEFVAIGTTGNIIHSEGQLIAAVGVHNMIVVSTKDALLLCPKDRAQDVKKIVDRLTELGMTQYL